MKSVTSALLFLGSVLLFVERIKAQNIVKEEKIKKLRTDEEIQVFREWAVKYKKVYSESTSKSEDEAMETFFDHLNKIEVHNKNPEKTFEMGLTEDSDLTYEEQKTFRMGLVKPKRMKRSHATAPYQYNQLVNFTAPKSVNYTENFPPIKHQGSCQSCWAFTAVDIIEYYLRQKGMNWSLSEQNLVDCSKLNYGCGGGWPTHAFTYIRDEGISNGSKYLYSGVKQECQRTQSKFRSILKIPDACEIFLRGNENLLMKIIARYGPVSGALSTTERFSSYKKGNFDDQQCRSHTVDHAVTICGYGSDPVYGDYWIIRNSWGKSWGMNGYGWVARNRNNSCGIALYAMFPCESTIT